MHRTQNHVVLPGENHLRTVVREYLTHYHGERNHQGLGNGLIEPASNLRVISGELVRQKRLGGLLNYYERKAA